jgi:hypothetical protein
MRVWNCMVCTRRTVRIKNMPTDSRRLQGPENTNSYTLYLPNDRTYHGLLNDLINNDEKRKDGRGLTDHRRICKKL